MKIKAIAVLGLSALLIAGCQREMEKMVEVTGHMFVFNYRVATATYLVTLRKTSPIPDGADIFVSIDCDGIDPSVFPAVKMPTPGGLSYEELIRVLRGCQLTLANVVCVRIFLTDFNGDYAMMNEIYATYFSADKRPARTTVGVTGLARGGVVEIDMIAVRS